MTYIVNDNCIACKYTDCVEVCPVDCFYEGENMLVIHPDECIDCGVCEPECPIEAIIPDNLDDGSKWLDVNEKYSQIWPNIKSKKSHPLMQKNMRVLKKKLKNILAKKELNNACKEKSNH